MKRNFFLLLLTSCFFCGFSQQEKPLNVVFIAVDDLKPAIGSFGDNFAITPNIDLLAEQASLFLNNHTQLAVCSPSRISLLTGLRPDKTKVYNLKTKMRDMNPSVVTLTQHFKAMGYTTAGVGKVFDHRGVDPHMDKPSWSLPFKRDHHLQYPKGWGAPVMGHYQSAEIKSKIDSFIKQNIIKKGSNISKALKGIYRPPVSSSFAPDEAYADGAVAKEAIHLLDGLSQNNKPFFLAVGFKRPHLPFSAPQKYWDLYKRERIAIEAFSQRAKNTGELAYHGSGELKAYVEEGRDYKTDLNNQLILDEKFQRELIHGYYACVSFIDFQIGKIVNSLTEKGLMKNTIIVIWGDHGYHLGDHRLWNKHSNFEQATRSPLIIYYPKAKTPQKILSPTEFVDVFPTLISLAEINSAKNLDGTSLVPLMMGKRQKVKDFAVSQFPRNGKMGYSFRTKKIRYTLWINRNKIGSQIHESDIVQEELFDYDSDPLETENLIGKDEYNVIYNQMKRKALVFLSSNS